jgi:hypothetical protein
MRLEFSFIGFVETACYIVIFMFLARSGAAALCARNPNSNLGQATAWVA